MPSKFQNLNDGGSKVPRRKTNLKTEPKRPLASPASLPTARKSSAIWEGVALAVLAGLVFFLFSRPIFSPDKPASIMAGKSPTKAGAAISVQPEGTANTPITSEGSPPAENGVASDPSATAEPGTPFTISPTQFTGATALRLYAGSSQDIAVAKAVLADIGQMFHAGDMAAFTDKYILPEDRDQVKQLLEKMQAEPPEQQFRWQMVLAALDALQDQTPGFTAAGVATFADHIIYGDTPQERFVPDNWVSLKKQDGQWYLTTGSAVDLYQGSHLKKNSEN